VGSCVAIYSSSGEESASQQGWDRFLSSESYLQSSIKERRLGKCLAGGINQGRETIKKIGHP